MLKKRTEIGCINVEDLQSSKLPEQQGGERGKGISKETQLETSLLLHYKKHGPVRSLLFLI